MYTKTLLAILATISTLQAAAAQDSLYAKNSPVLQFSNKAKFDRFINESNKTTIIEYYAPWCGHCKNLKPQYEKAAKSLEGFANVVAINCEENKAMCTGVQGFPTLKIARPPKERAKGRRTVIDNYERGRSAAEIVEAVTSQMNNHVVKVTDSTLDSFLASSTGAKALLFTEKGTTSPSTKALATEFLGSIAVGQVRNKEAATVAKYGVTKFPTLIILPEGDDTTPLVHDGKFKLKDMIEFFSQVAEPNPPVDLDAKKPKSKKEETPKAEKKEKKEKAKKTEKAEKAENVEEKETKEESTETTETPTQQTAPVIVESALPIPTIHTTEKLQNGCLSDKAPTCVLVFGADEDASAKTKEALDHLAEIAHKFAQQKRALFPFYAIPSTNPASSHLLQAMEIEASTDGVQLVAVNARRSWFRKFEGGADLSQEAIEKWIDDIRMGEGKKSKLPEELVVKAKKEKVEEKAGETTKEKAEEPKEEVKHEEL